MNNFLQRIIIEPLDRFLERLIQFLPDILTSILIFISGIILGVILKAVFLRIFRAIKLDKFSERSGVSEMMQKGGIKDPLSLILAKLTGWLIVISFLTLSLRSLNIAVIQRILESFIVYLPNVFVAAIILFLGYVLGNFLGRAALIASVNAGIRLSGLIGRSVKVAIFVLAVTMALEQLGIGRGTIVIAFAIIFGGVVLALALAFGLGGRDIARQYLEKKIRGGEKKDDIHHI